MSNENNPRPQEPTGQGIPVPNATIPPSMNIPVESLAPFTRFCCSLGMIPSSYKESLTYEEQLMWLCNYLENTVIPTVNNNTAVFTEVQTLFNQLRDYVDNYFTNLDVQQEINNKLDTMAEDGTLISIIAPYLQPFIDEQNERISQVENFVYASTNINPLIANSMSQMTDTTRIYVLTTDGYWYYWNGTEWTAGGIYTSITGYNEAIDDLSILPNNFVFTKKNLKENLLLNSRKNVSSTVTGMTVSNFSTYLENSEVADTSNPFRIRYDNGSLIVKNWNWSIISSTNPAYFIYYFAKDGSYLSRIALNSDSINQIPANAYFASIVYYDQPSYDSTFTDKNVEWLNPDAKKHTNDLMNEVLNDFSIVPSMFKFNYKKLRNNLTLNAGKNLPTTNPSSITIENFEENLIDSTVASISNPFRIKYDDGTPIIPKWNINRTSTSNAVFVWYFDKSGNYVQYRSQAQVTNNEGVIPENAYYAMLIYYSNLPEFDHYFSDVNVDWLNPKTKEYWVGNTSSDDYSSILECFDALKNNIDEKIIYIRPGTYDIFDEMGGSEFALNIQEGTLWQDVSVFVPENSHIIGLGNVVLNLLPEADKISEAGSHLLSILNVKGNCTIENLTLNAKNVRYCIHDEVGTDTAYYFKKHVYKNIECNYQSTAYSGIGGQSYASGFVNGNSFEFHNCKFKTNVGKSACSFHNGANGTGNIIMKDCIFESYSDSYSGLAFNNTSVNQHTINVKLSNCYIGSKGLTLGNNISSTNVKNNFKVIANNCNDFTVTVVDSITNIFEVEKYNSIS